MSRFRRSEDVEIYVENRHFNSHVRFHIRDGVNETVLDLEDSLRTKSRGLGLDLEESIYLLSVVLTDAVPVTRSLGLYRARDWHV